MVEPDPERTDDPLGETIAYRHGEAAAVEPDGFPEVDDLVERTLGQYRLGPVIGRGSMGRVYRAEHSGLGRTCAIKVMNPGLVARQPQTVERFWAEARAVAGLVHPHIVTVHNLGTDRGYHYIEMEYVPGGVSLRETLIRQGPLEPVRATTLVRQVALALGAAHRAGLVHRDIKPANVLLTAEGQAKLADFGLVRRLDDRGGAPVAGTPTFMAPELFTGAAAGPRSDLYAVGVMFFYLLSARLPFVSDRIDQLIRLHRREPVPDIRRWAPEVPDEAAEILARLLQKDPGRRYESAEDLADDLRRVIGHLRDTEGLVREALEGIDGFVQQGGRDHFRLVLPVPGDRLQEVYIEVTQGRNAERLLQVFSVCGPADPSHYEFALKLNSELTIGGLSIREVNGQPMFVMTRTYSRAHVTATDIRAAVLEIARRGDWVEQQLGRDDVF
jgi:serine/threonine-protein kinase